MLGTNHWGKCCQTFKNLRIFQIFNTEKKFLENQFELYLNAESRVDRPTKIPDTRVHACLYFIAPSGHGLKPLDIEFMRRLHDKVEYFVKS